MNLVNVKVLVIISKGPDCHTSVCTCVCTKWHVCKPTHTLFIPVCPAGAHSSARSFVCKIHLVQMFENLVELAGKIYIFHWKMMEEKFAKLFFLSIFQFILLVAHKNLEKNVCRHMYMQNWAHTKEGQVVSSPKFIIIFIRIFRTSLGDCYWGLALISTIQVPFIVVMVF